MRSGRTSSCWNACWGSSSSSSSVSSSYGKRVAVARAAAVPCIPEAGSAPFDPHSPTNHTNVPRRSLQPSSSSLSATPQLNLKPRRRLLRPFGYLPCPGHPDCHATCMPIGDNTKDSSSPPPYVLSLLPCLQHALARLSFLPLLPQCSFCPHLRLAYARAHSELRALLGLLELPVRTLGHVCLD